ncbi:TonB-dependent receptor domain-containing protein [Eilatimonas milleporae]|uniref:TonB-dependent receptor n=1 Tax=Eilatimonas milleporae TaxID=911205 RepID=A0A3M0CS93_9PROT|nr:TonB-dependent receptor [Eilatimonas milleporae]RMB11797.1 TonB-dependent receptor [Eilatimonas milleporae]
MKSFHKTLKGALLASTVMVLPAAAFAQESEDTAGPQDDIEEVVVQGQYIPDEKRATSEISNVLDATELARTGDSDIAVALQRVTGLSLVGEKYVYVRGLGERYSSVLLNGSVLPGTDPTRRVVPLDIFPTALLEEALVQKTYSPEFPAEFGGGVINLRTKAVPDEGFFRFGLGGAYNTVSTDDGLSYDGPDSEAFGFAGGRRNIPDEVLRDITLESLTPDELEAAGEAVAAPAQWSIDGEPNLPDFNFELAAGDNFTIGDTKVGFVTAVTYTNQYTNKFGVRRNFALVGDGQLVPNENFSPDACQGVEGIDPADCGLRSTEQDISLNGVVSLGIELDPNNVLKLTSTILRQSTKEATIEQGDFAFDPGTVRTRSRTDWVERQVWANQVEGAHTFALFGDSDTFFDTQLDWRFNYSRTDRDAPLRRETVYEYEDFDQIFRFDPSPQSGRTTWGALDDEQYEVGFNLTQPMSVGTTPVDIKAGFTYFDKQRSSGFVRYIFDFPGGDTNALRERVPETIFGPVNIDPNGIVLEEQFDPSDAFDASLENWQGYLAADIQVTPKLRAALGARYEDSEQVADTVNRLTDEPIVVIQNNSQWLPAATLTYEFTDNVQLRAGYSKTLSRPDLRELTSAPFLDNELDQLRRGNPFLEITEIDNFDARFEWYFGIGESATIGAFYKDFTNPIEETFSFQGEQPFLTYQNALGAEVYGIEAEIVKNLDFQDWFGWKWLGGRDFYVNANGSWIDSEVSLPDPNDVPIDVRNTNLVRPLQGQSDLLANFQFGFEDFESGEQAAIILNYTSDRIFLVGIQGRPDVIEEPPIMLNFVYRRNFETWGRPLQVSFRAENLLDDDFRLLQGDQLFQQYDIGVTLSIGLNYTF